MTQHIVLMLQQLAEGTVVTVVGERDKKAVLQQVAFQERTTASLMSTEDIVH